MSKKGTQEEEEEEADEQEDGEEADEEDSDEEGGEDEESDDEPEPPKLELPSRATRGKRLEKVRISCTLRKGFASDPVAQSSTKGVGGLAAAGGGGQRGRGVLGPGVLPGGEERQGLHH